MSGKGVDLVFTDLPEPVSRRVPEYMSDVPLRWRIAEPGCRTAGEVVTAGAGAGALIPWLAPITAEVVERLPALRIIAVPFVGADGIALDTARSKGVWVTNVPDGNRLEVASHTVAMILSLLRGLPAMDRAVREGNWHYMAGGVLHRSTTLTLGIVGCGGIGRQVAVFAGSLFARTLGCDPAIESVAWPDHIERVPDIETLFAESNVVTLHVPLTPETEGLVNLDLLRRLPPGSHLVNAARGPVLNPVDLVAALDEGVLAGAALDVLPVEPPEAGDPLLAHPNILLSPHAAAYSEESREETMRRAIRSVADVLQGRRPRDVLVTGRL